MKKICVLIIMLLILAGCTHNIIIGDDLSNLLKQQEKEYIYKKGYREGFNSGYKKGYNHGLQDGYKKGYKDGMGIEI